MSESRISYKLLALFYVVCVAACILLGLLQSLGYDFLAGYWIILAPYFPCLMWVLVMMRRGAHTERTKDKNE